MKLWDFQETAIDLTRDAFRRNKRVILTLPTGSGKTVIALHIVKKALEKNLKVAFICDRLSLLDQTAKFMYQQGLDFGIIQGNNELTDFSKQFQICSAQTLARRNHTDFDLLIIDEAHIMFKHQLELLKNANGAYFLGLTATPFTKGLGKYWDELVSYKGTGELIREGYLSQYTVYGPSKPDLNGIKMSAGDYNKKDLAKRTDKKKLVGDIIEHWFKLANDRHTIVMGVNVAHAEHIADEFKKQNVKADVIHCYMNREEVKRKLDMFRSGELQILSSVDMISRGFDMPRVDCIIIARPTKSLNYHLQALGRGLRIHNEKKNCLILDHAGNIERLGFPCDEFPMILNVSRDQLKKKKTENAKKAMPHPCPKCFFMKTPGQKECPKCHFEEKRLPGIETKQGELEEIQKRRLKKSNQQNKDAIYARLLAGALVVGFKDGWASYRYREHFGVWPARKVGMDNSFYDWIKGQPKGQQFRILYSITN